MLALDFDGLICDGLAECLLVTWNGVYDLPLEDFSHAGLARIPRSFVDRFIHCRSFARHLGHFMVSFASEILAVEDEAQFEALYARFPAAEVEDFMDRVSRYRHRARVLREGEWLSHHALYPGMRDFLSARAGGVYIVTAKDADSVTKILATEGVQIAPERVYGERREKTSALRDIAARERLPVGEVCLVDDNLLNVLDARAAGFDGLWAMWGYAAPSHRELAVARNVPRQTLDGFFTLTQGS
jgi:phosphoglycolate phosphatase-like HAD superfamily hydrolase